MRLSTMTVGAHRGAKHLSNFRQGCIFLIFINMVSGGGLVVGREFRLGALTFVADDSAWLQEAVLDVEALPIRGASHFRVSACSVLL